MPNNPVTPIDPPSSNSENDEVKILLGMTEEELISSAKSVAIAGLAGAAVGWMAHKKYSDGDFDEELKKLGLTPGNKKV